MVSLVVLFTGFALLAALAVSALRHVASGLRLAVE
jgi:hypothetical protein